MIMKSFFAAFLTVTHVAATQCYNDNDGGVKEVDWNTCGAVDSSGSHVSCCASGSYCLDDGICGYQDNDIWGYYVGGCTDPTMEDTSCQRACNDTSLPDIVYDYAQGLWKCCGTIDGVTQCDDAANDVFLAPAPGSMTIKYAVKAIEPTSTASSKTTTTSAATSLETSTEFQELRARSILVQRNSTTNSTQPTSQTAASGLSKRAIGGIAAGASVAFLLLVSALVVLFLCYRRPHRGAYREPEWQMQNADDYGPLAAARRSSEVSSHDPSIHHADLEALSKVTGGYDYNVIASHDSRAGREAYVLPPIHEMSEGTYVLSPVHEERSEGRYLLPPIHEERFEDTVELAG